jgi:hypothetical protein
VSIGLKFGIRFRFGGEGLFVGAGAAENGVADAEQAEFEVVLIAAVVLTPPVFERGDLFVG